ncbi:hypothetical protein B0H11DRAFT_2072852 [Mycena galericulata]|nr:hypothetical protein B0H11DRAFT_2072852 [Mycena galericulata]
MTLVLAFLVICIGIVLLQISKSTPHDVGKSELARHSTFLVWSPSEVSEEKTVRSSPPKSEHQIPNPDPADARDILINAPRGSLGLTLAGIIQAWRHGVDSDFDESPDAHEVDLGNRGMLHNDDKYESDSESLRFSEATWRRLVPGETRRRVSITAR